MTGERLSEILKNAIAAYESELESQDYPSEEELHKVVLNEFGMTEEEYQSVMDGTAFATPRVLLLDWAANDEQGVNVIGIYPNMESAKKAFAENVQAERELAEQGCVVIESYGKSYWGRTTTGQSISLDGCIASIAKKLQILEGMENEWRD